MKTLKPQIALTTAVSAGEAPIANFGGYYYETFDIGSDIGSDLGTPVSSNYASPFPFSGNIESVRVDLQ